MSKQAFLCLFISHELIRHEYGRGHKIDGTKPNQTGSSTVGEKKQNRESRQKGTNMKVASKGHCREGGTQERQKEKEKKKEKKYNHIIRVGQEKLIRGIDYTMPGEYHYS